MISAAVGRVSPAAG